MAFKEKFLRFNHRVAHAVLFVLSPLLLGLLWLSVGLSAILPRLFGSRLLIPFRRGGDSHWVEHEPVDMTARGMRRQG